LTALCTIPFSYRQTSNATSSDEILHQHKSGSVRSKSSCVKHQNSVNGSYTFMAVMSNQAGDNPEGASIQAFVNAGLPLLLPRPRQRIMIGQGFLSSLVASNGNPWKTSALHSGALDEEVVDLDLQCTNNSFKDSFTNSSEQSSDHFSGSFGLAVGNALVSGGVSASYDKLVAESHEVWIVIPLSCFPTAPSYFVTFNY
jgi:hypothetical protein